MMNESIAEALAPQRERMRHPVREQEIMRIAASLPPEAGGKVVAEARRQVLAWAQRRSGGRLPSNAWDGAGFDYLAGGRTTLAVRLAVDSADLWALRADDPDSSVAGRVWTTEVTIGHAGEAAPRISVRLLVSTSEDQLEIEPHTPGFLRQLTSTCGVQVDGCAMRSDARRIRSEADVEQLIALVEYPERKLPVVVATGDERSDKPDESLIDADLLARATIGLAHVVVVPAVFTYSLSDAFGRTRSVYHGAVRVYQPGFDAAATPYGHRLFLSDTLRTAEQAERSVQSLRRIAARESLRRWHLNHDVLTFGSVRSAVLRAEQERQAAEGASDGDRLRAAQAQIRALDEEKKNAKDWEDQLTHLHDEAEARAIAAEGQLRGSVNRIQQLEELLRDRDQIPDAELAVPAAWPDFADWCDNNLIGRVVLSPSARRGVKKPEFQDVTLAARCLIWLANQCRDRRINGGGSLTDVAIENGVRNSPCGGDAYEFDYQGQRLSADWHIKNGGNTRYPSRCLRIYYAWDAQSQQIVVADMPAHRRTGAT